MRHFVVEIKYTAPLEVIDSIVARHRQFLSDGYKKGILLMSGPMNPKTGGMVIARAESQEDLKKFMDNDPYKLENAAEHLYKEFTPVLSRDFLKDWIS